MTAYKYYEEAKFLAQELRNSGLSAYAEQILAAMEEGATGTEIFMIMRMRLNNILLSGGPPELMGKAQQLYTKLNEALN